MNTLILGSFWSNLKLYTMADYVESNYTARVGATTISTANSGLDGSGSIESVIVGSTNGTLVKTVIIKAQTDTSEGMVRVFVKKAGGSDLLLSEVYVPPVKKSGRDVSFYRLLALNYLLADGEKLSVSTQEADTFNVIALGLERTFTTSTTYLGNTIEYIATDGMATIDTANPNLDGTGAMQKIIEADAGMDGCVVSSIAVKAQETTNPGMVRLFIQPAPDSDKILFCETIIPYVYQSAHLPAFGISVINFGNICLGPGSSIWASTELDNTFNVISTGLNWDEA